MNLLHFLALQCCLALLVLSAPLQDSRLTLADPEFKLAVVRSNTLVEKILEDIPVVHKNTIHSTENSLSRMSVGIKLHQDLLGALAARLEGLDDLRADLRDLLTQINKMQELGRWSSDEPYQSPDIAAHLHGDYELQVATHLTLTQLRAFCQDIVRSMRNISVYRPQEQR
ncbi:uncharacterized protein LOC132450450 isoform X2 [Gadus macrocephalus]|uniref:uncharacterized protein LOC132450450 isoform X2 n=1 Tax=Gadus macrocephalus TaxID=80720 RepID=UPI0028CB434C|nr:uncharacterized protein LOC132450450 isoform X2 [Gadus macrocephalus]